MNEPTTPESSGVSTTTAPNARDQTVLVIRVLGYGIMSFLCLVLIVHLRHNRAGAFKGDSSAARRILLPAFEPLLWILAVTTGLFTATILTILLLRLFPHGMPEVATDCFYCERQFVFALFMVLMHQKSVSLQALRRCVAISLLLASYPLPFVFLTTYSGGAASDSLFFHLRLAIRLPLVAWYAYIFCHPPSRASTRSIREFCVFTFVYHLLSVVSAELTHFNYYTTGGPVEDASLLWAALCPLVGWRVLRADTEHWRGMGQRACALQTEYRHQHEIHEHLSSEGLHVLIEMHRKLVIDFAYLELGQKIGVGSSAVVFRGTLHSRTPVAAKMYTPLALTDEVVASFSQEAALCGALRHPNVVTFYGMCVSPPTIGLVFELCQGSLENVLLASAREDPSVRPQRQTLSIALAYMIDAARAVAYLHSFQPCLLHRDVKPSNFLVDNEHTVKLADFGESRCAATLPDERASVIDNTGVTMEQRHHATKPERLGVVVLSPSVSGMRETMAQKMTVKGTVDYMAPELINGKGGFACYGEAADVYSLALTMWDILHPGQDRYPGYSDNHLHIFQAVLDGKRPELADTIHPTLRELIGSAWHVDPRLRPSAHVIVNMLEAIEEEVSASFLLDAFDEFGLDSVVLLVPEEDEPNGPPGSSNGAPTGSSSGGGGATATDAASSFTGADAVRHMVTNKYVATVGEALRLGRMWMDAGLLHHVKHAQGFTNDDAAFYLDEGHIRLCQPIMGGVRRGGKERGRHDSTSGGGNLPTRWTTSTRPPSSVSGRTDSSSARETGSRLYGLKSEATVLTLGGRATVCACRKFGQRQIHDVKPRRHQRFKRKKVTTILEANMLTASLLTPDDGLSVRDGVRGGDGSSDFADFEWPLASARNSANSATH